MDDTGLSAVGGFAYCSRPVPDMRLRHILLILVALLLALLVARNVIVKHEARKIIEKQTGFGLQVGSIDVGLWTASVNIEGLKLINPPDFPEPTAFDIRQAKADYDLTSLFRRETRLSEVVLDVPLVVVVKKADGETNLQRLSAAAKKPEGGAPGPGPEPEGRKRAPKKEARPFLIDRLVVRVGTVEIHDYTVKGEQPGITAFTLNIDQVHTNVHSVAQIGELLVAGVLEQVGDKFLGDLARGLNKGAKDADLDGKLKKVSRNIGKALEGIFGDKKQ